jgi:hypothetical protein
MIGMPSSKAPEGQVEVALIKALTNGGATTDGYHEGCRQDRSAVDQEEDGNHEGCPQDDKAVDQEEGDQEGRYEEGHSVNEEAHDQEVREEEGRQAVGQEAGDQEDRRFAERDPLFRDARLRNLIVCIGASPVTTRIKPPRERPPLVRRLLSCADGIDESAFDD